MTRSPNTRTGPGPEPVSSTSTSLLQRVKARDPEAWKRLVALFGPLVYDWCRQSGLHGEDAADVGQEVFGSVAAKVAEFRRDRPGDSFRGWLWTITRNKIRDHFRQQQGQAQAQGGTDAQQRLAQVPEQPPGSTVGSAPSDDQVSVVHGLLAGIRSRFADHTWQAFWRTTVGREVGTDVAADLGMSVQAVYQAKYRVLQQVREELGDLFI